MNFLKTLMYKEDKQVLSYPVKEYPRIYNQYGEKMKMFYLKDQIMAPYSESRYFMWDRCNYGLDTHFYAHNNMLFPCGYPIRKYGFLIESKQIVPDNYRIFDKNKGLANEYDAIFTYDEELLDKLPNAEFFPSCVSVWYGKKTENFIGIRNVIRRKINKYPLYLQTKKCVICMR